MSSPFVNNGKAFVREQPEVTSFVEPPEANRGIKGGKLRVFQQDSKNLNSRKEKFSMPKLSAIR